MFFFQVLDKGKRKIKLQFTGVLQDEYKTGKNPRRQILAQSGKIMFQLPMCVQAWSWPAVSTAGA